MGAGYTRWFKEGGFIGLFDKAEFNGQFWYQVDPPQVVATPVWPTKKTSILPGKDDLLDAFLGLAENTKRKDFISPLSLSFDNETYKGWDLGYGLSQTVLMNKDQLKYYRKDAMPITVEEKKNRFVRAGGSFDQMVRTTVDGQSWIKKCSVTSAKHCSIVPSYIIPYSGHYHPDTERMARVTEEKERDHNFENILQNTEENVWVASRNRRLYIRDNSIFPGYSDPRNEKSMTDKHLVNTMRYLVSNYKEIKDRVLKVISPENAVGILASTWTVKRKDLLECKHAPDLYSEILPCWPTLCSEVKERFGAEALTAILDGF